LIEGKGIAKKSRRRERRGPSCFGGKREEEKIDPALFSNRLEGGGGGIYFGIRLDRQRERGEAALNSVPCQRREWGRLGWKLNAWGKKEGE